MSECAVCEHLARLSKTGSRQYALLFKKFIHMIACPSSCVVDLVLLNLAIVFKRPR